MLPNYGQSGDVVQYWQRLLEYVGIDLPEYGTDGDYGDETKSAVAQWFKRRTGEDFSGDRITSWIAVHLQDEYFGRDRGGATDEQIAAAVAEYLQAHPPKDGKTPTKVTIELTGDVTAVE